MPDVEHSSHLAQVVQLSLSRVLRSSALEGCSRSLQEVTPQCRVKKGSSTVMSAWAQFREGWLH